jgi:sulfur-carrier protein
MTVESEPRARVGARVHLPLALRPEARGDATVHVSCATVRQALDAVCGAHPTLRRHLFDEAGALRPHVNIFVNEVDARASEGLGTRVQPGDEIHIVPSIAGG